jgi:hypothetical protein
MSQLLSSLFELLPDVAGILLAALSLSLIFLPRELRVLEAPKWKWLRWTLAAIFAIVGVGGLVSNYIQKSQDKKERSKLQGDVARLNDDIEAVKRKLGENQNASIGLVVAALATSGQELKPNVNMPFFIYYVVQKNPAKNVRMYQEILSVKGPFTSEQARIAHAKFLGRAIPTMDSRGQDFPANATFWRTLQLKMNSSEIKELLLDQRTVYIMGRVEWKNSSGSDDHFDLCSFMEPPKMKYLIQSELPFHICGL